MRFNRQNLLLVATALCITLVILLGGQYIWKYFALTKPLDQDIMKISGVNTVAWKEQSTNKTAQAVVSLDQLTDFRKSYREIMRISQEHFPQYKIEIELKDTRDKKMEEFYNQIHLYIYEAIETGYYTKMQEIVQRKAEEQGLAVKVFVDSERLYIHVVDGAKNLYEVIPRVNREVKS